MYNNRYKAYNLYQKQFNHPSFLPFFSTILDPFVNQITKMNIWLLFSLITFRIMRLSAQNCYPGYTQCAQEGGTCVISSNIQEGYISYGTSGRYNFVPFTNKKNDGSDLRIQCDNDHGDIYYGRTKYCCYKADSFTPFDNGNEYGYVTEGNYWNFPQGTNGIMRYGADEKYVYRVFSGSTAWCNNQFFNDIFYGVSKHCNMYSQAPTNFIPGPTSSQWTYCGDEGSDCSGIISGTRWIRYGDLGKYYYKYVSTSDGKVPCSNSFFEDPFPGENKNCWRS
eukprot:498235_1